jgi:hypothetical protein
MRTANRKRLLSGKEWEQGQKPQPILYEKERSWQQTAVAEHAVKGATTQVVRNPE